MADSEIEKTLSKIKTTTIRELGNKLPIGNMVNGILDKSFSFIDDLTTQDEIKISNIKKQNKKDRGVGLSKLVSFIVRNIGGLNLYDEEIKGTKKISTNNYLNMKNLYICDIWYAYILARINIVGSELTVTNKVCERCDHKFDLVYDLNDFVVKYVEDEKTLKDLNNLEFEYIFKKPFKYYNNTIVKAKIGVPTWGTIFNMTDDNEGSLMLASIASVIKCLIAEDGKNITHIEPSQLNLSKLDTNGLKSEIKKFDLADIGANINYQYACPKCGHEHEPEAVTRMDYDSFFTV